MKCFHYEKMPAQHAIYGPSAPITLDLTPDNWEQCAILRAKQYLYIGVGSWGGRDLRSPTLCINLLVPLWMLSASVPTNLHWRYAGLCGAIWADVTQNVVPSLHEYVASKYDILAIPVGKSRAHLSQTGHQ